VPTSHQWPPGMRQSPPAAGMQLNHIGVAEGADIDQSLSADCLVQSAPAAGRAMQAGRAGACCWCPHVVAAARGSAQSSVVRVIELYQVSVHPSEGWKAYELRWLSTLRAHNCGIRRPTIAFRTAVNPLFG